MWGRACVRAGGVVGGMGGRSVMSAAPTAGREPPTARCTHTQHTQHAHSAHNTHLLDEVGVRAARRDKLLDVLDVVLLLEELFELHDLVLGDRLAERVVVARVVAVCWVGCSGCVLCVCVCVAHRG